MQEQELQVVVWYSKEDWETYRTMFSDGDRLPQTYDMWLEMAQQQVKAAEDAGDLVAKVTIDTEIFPAWCKKHQRPMDAEARTTFAIQAVQQQQMLNNM